MLLALIAVLGFSALTVPADAASTKRITLGKGNMKFKPLCGKGARGCSVEGKVTGYQAVSRTTSGRNFVVPWKGKIVSWSISLANPTRRQIENEQGEITQFNEMLTFNGYFGSPSKARISVLKQVQKKKKGPPRYEMVRQSPVQILNPYFGSTVQFALEKPLNVIRNQVVALTIPTWAPALWIPTACDSGMDNPGCVALEDKYTWRGSRGGGEMCAIGASGGVPNEALEKSRSQQKVGSVKRYGCYYGPNVLVYSANIVGPG